MARGLPRYFTGYPCKHGHIAERETDKGGCCECSRLSKQRRRSRRPGYRSREQITEQTASGLRTCTTCKRTFEATDKHFVPLVNKVRNWTGLSAECRQCRNKRYEPYYKKHRAKIIERTIISTRERREQPEVQEQERIASRERKRRKLANIVERKKHNARRREWIRKNPELVKLFKHEQPAMKRYRAAKGLARLATPPWLTDEHWKQMVMIYKMADELTRTTGIKHEVDHYYPLTCETCCGLHVPWNLRVVTQVENKSKANQLPEVWWQ
jgi:hypothetical protein